MSFFKKLKEEWKELVGDDKDKKDEKKDQVNPQTSQDPTLTSQRDGSYDRPQQHQYQPPPQNLGQAPPSQGPPLPPGWTQQWDANSQRYYYIDPTTGRSQWEPPNFQHQGYGAPPPSSQGYYGAPQPHDQAYPPAHYASTYPTGATKQKSGSGKGGLIAAGVGGAAIGALGAAALSGDSSDDESHAPAMYGAPPAAGYGSTAPPPAPVPLEDNPNLSSSQRSSLEEAREDLDEAEAKVQGDSSASSSDIEELEEAREEYASEAESAQEELED